MMPERQGCDMQAAGVTCDMPKTKKRMYYIRTHACRLCEHSLQIGSARSLA